MSVNLVELVRRHHDVGAPTALEVLKAALEDHGEITDDDRRLAAELSGLPEAAVHGVSTFYDDLLQPRGERHIRVCTGTACFAATADAHVDALRDVVRARARRTREDGSVSLAETVCLGFCHSSPAVRDGDVIDAGPGVVERVVAGDDPRPAASRRGAARSTSPCSRVGTTGAGSRTRSRRSRRRSCSTRSRPPTSAAAAAPASPRATSGSSRATPRRAQVHRRQRRRGRPRLLHRQVPDGAHPALLLEGMALAGYAVGADHGFVLTRSEYPRSKPRSRRRSRAHGPPGCSATRSSAADFSFDITVLEGAGSYVVGEETALLACLEGLRGTVSARPPFPAQRGLYGMPTVVNNVETLCNIPFVARRGADAYARAQPRPDAGTKLVCFNERFARPASTRCRSGRRCASSARTSRAACATVARSRRCRSAGRSAGSCRRRCSTRASTSTTSRRSAAWSATAASSRFDETHRHARPGHAPAALRRRRELREVLPVPHRPAPGVRDVRGRRAGRPLRFEALLEALELGSLCAHGGGMPAPIRSLLAHFPDELGLA